MIFAIENQLIWLIGGTGLAGRGGGFGWLRSDPAGVVAVALLGHLLYRNLTKKTPKFRADAKSTELPKSGGAKMPGELPSAQA